MTEKYIFLKLMETEFPVTVKVLKAFPSDKPDFTPHERSQTARKIMETLIGETRAMVKILADDENIFTPVGAGSIPEAIELYEKSFADALSAIKDTSDEELEKPLAGMMGKYFPRRIDGMWAFAKDTIHHRGQLSVYIRLAGGKVPSIYGPSADENPFE